ncbi:hypothetical protein JXB31_05295 [Candidatus Woesearchaeota archaeon]|nr:hypothetical protein [Candidatus Woesearchaeota archaeon]
MAIVEPIGTVEPLRIEEAVLDDGIEKFNERTSLFLKHGLAPDSLLYYNLPVGGFIPRMPRSGNRKQERDKRDKGGDSQNALQE